MSQRGLADFAAVNAAHGIDSVIYFADELSQLKTYEVAGLITVVARWTQCTRLL